MDGKNSHIQASSLKFLKDLEQNNNREWFNEHKDLYQRELLKIESFVDNLLNRMKRYDKIETASGKKAMMRIYRDIRFSSDKKPYKTSWSGGFQRMGKQLRGGYYFRFKPGQSLIAGGFRGPETADLKIIREEFAFDDNPIRKILKLPKIVKEFKNMTGETLKTIPRGYAADHPAADLLRHKQFIFERRFTDTEILKENFIEKAVGTMRAFRPFFDYMSEVLFVPD